MTATNIDIVRAELGKSDETPLQAFVRVMLPAFDGVMPTLDDMIERAALDGIRIPEDALSEARWRGPLHRPPYPEPKGEE